MGTRIRDYSETIPKHMIPIGNQPMLVHIMEYYSHFGYRDFILCLGYKANVIKDHFLNINPSAYGDCIISEFGKKVETLGANFPDWRIALIDTGIWRNIGERLMAIRPLVQDEEMFLANYSDGLTDLDLPRMIEWFKKSRKVGCFVAVRPLFNFHLVQFDEHGRVNGLRGSQESEIWINGGYFVFRNTIFDFIREGEDLVFEPFCRLIQAGELLVYKHDGFWRAMDTLRDKQILEDMVEKGQLPWRFQMP
jgi:glucose-1-phosphate cytidylyltransferase